jgi:signal transduction histidine kinase
MTSRAQESGGTLEVDSSPGRGTRVIAKLPVQPAEGTDADTPEGRDGER